MHHPTFRLAVLVSIVGAALTVGCAGLTGSGGSAMVDLNGRWSDESGESIEIEQSGLEVKVRAVTSGLQGEWTEGTGLVLGTALALSVNREDGSSTLVGQASGSDRIDWQDGAVWRRDGRGAGDGDYILQICSQTLGGAPVGDTTTADLGCAARFNVVPGSSQAAAAQQREEEHELTEGVAYFALHTDGSWKQVTASNQIRAMINNPKIPTSSPTGRSENWYFVPFDRAKRYRFEVKEAAFRPRIGYAYTIPAPIGNQWTDAATGSSHVTLGATDEFQPGFTGPHWVVVSTRFRDAPSPPGKYTWSYTYYPGADRNGSYSEASVVAMLNVPRLNEDATLLYLNFDGFPAQPGQNSTGRTLVTTNGKGVWVNEWDRFDETSYLSGSLAGAVGRDGVIQHFVYKASEAFAPFHVIVRSRSGAGSYDSTTRASTLFVGNNPYGSGLRAFQRRSINNHDFGNKSHDLGWLDVFNDETGNWASLTYIVNSISHEAGHSFGLIHVRTKGSDKNGSVSFNDWIQAGFAPRSLPVSFNSNGTEPEAMSYDSSNRLFVDKEFSVSGWNNTSQGLRFECRLYETFRGSTIVTQNSFRYLRQVLGARGRFDSIANVADRDAILQPRDRKRIGGSTGIDDLELNYEHPYATVPRPSTIETLGDYDVFNLQLNRPGALTVECSPQEGSALDPIVLVYGEDGKVLRAYDDNSQDGVGSRVTITNDPNKKFKVVVGAKDNLTTGAYELRLR